MKPSRIASALHCICILLNATTGRAASIKKISWALNIKDAELFSSRPSNFEGLTLYFSLSADFCSSPISVKTFPVGNRMSESRGERLL